MALASRPTRYHHVLFNVSFLSLWCFFLLASRRHSPPPNPRLHEAQQLKQDDGGCEAFQSLQDDQSKCSYLQARSECVCAPQAYINYLQIYYCACGAHPLVGDTLLALWLLVLFYLLGNTASRYFCSSLESLSRVLRLSPSIAGVTLLSLGNGAPDVFSSIVSFAGSGEGGIGLSSVLGGALFVSSVVVGVISVCGSRRDIQIERGSFVRDVCFLALVLCCLLAILLVGRIGLWGSLSFFSLYIVYVLVVSATHICREKPTELGLPLLDDALVVVVVHIKDPVSTGKEFTQDLGQCDVDVGKLSCGHLCRRCCWKRLIQLVEMPLYLPRRLTIPDVSEERWSKPFAVASASLSPLLLAALCDSQAEEAGSERSLLIYMAGGAVGMALGIAALKTTEDSNPPRKWLFPWLAGGFLMSVIWAYITARELVSVLVSLGIILGMSPSILGLTVLAWGNSIGDLIANVAMAVNGGPEGAQIAISGCYAGPIFNTLVGLGLSLVIASWAAHPSPFLVPGDSAELEALAFLLAGLLWALVMLPRRDMKLDKAFGVGLLAIYLCFLSLRLAQSLGLLQFTSFFHL